MTTLLRALCLSVLAGPAAAAILTVGPTGQFAEIADAVAAAQPDDVILVEPGTYAAFTVDKPLRVFGTAPGVLVSSFGTTGVEITGVASGEDVIVAGLEVQSNPVFSAPIASIVVRDSEGTVVLQDVLVDYVLSATGVQVESSDRVLLLDSDILNAGGPAAVVATSSELWIADSTVTGRNPSSGFIEPGADGLFASASTVRVWRSEIAGGDASMGKPSLFIDPDGGDGICAESSVVELYGGSAGSVGGGDGSAALFFGNDGVGGAAVRLSLGSTARIQADLPLSGGLDAMGTVMTPDVVADASSTSQLDPTVFPTLSASAPQTAVGGSFSAQVEGSPLSVAVLFTSFETGPTLAVPGVEGLGVLNPLLFLQLAVVALDGAGAATIAVSVPPTPALLGTSLVLQAVEAAGVSLLISNPALVSVTG
ncbi:MAG: hypothetical protein AAF682_29280 [Planctomycetota bacterium]